MLSTNKPRNDRKESAARLLVAWSFVLMLCVGLVVPTAIINTRAATPPENMPTGADHYYAITGADKVYYVREYSDSTFTGNPSPLSGYNGVSLWDVSLGLFYNPADADTTFVIWLGYNNDGTVDNCNFSDEHLRLCYGNFYVTGSVTAVTGYFILDYTAVVTFDDINCIYSTVNRIVHMTGSSTMNMLSGTISNTSSGSGAYAVYNGGDGDINILGGTIDTKGGITICCGLGKTTISGGTVSQTTGSSSSTMYAISVPDIYPLDHEALSITGGTVSATAVRAIAMNGLGKVSISGGLVTAGGDAIIMMSDNSKVTATYEILSISGGTVQKTGSGSSSYGIMCYAGKISVSGTALVTGNTYFGTIRLEYGRSRLEVSGGTIESTSTASAIFCTSEVTLTISGGTVRNTNGLVMDTHYLGFTTGYNINITGGTIEGIAGSRAIRIYSSKAKLTLGNFNLTGYIDMPFGVQTTLHESYDPALAGTYNFNLTGTIPTVSAKNTFLAGTDGKFDDILQVQSKFPIQKYNMTYEFAGDTVTIYQDRCPVCDQPTEDCLCCPACGAFPACEICPICNKYLCQCTCDPEPEPTCECDICPVCGGCTEETCCGASDCTCTPCTCAPNKDDRFNMFNWLKRWWPILCAVLVVLVMSCVTVLVMTRGKNTRERKAK